MSDAQESMKRVTDVVSLCLGDFVQARLQDGRTIYDGEVESVDFQHGFLWIRHGALKERKLLDVSEYEMWWRPI